MDYFMSMDFSLSYSMSMSMSGTRMLVEMLDELEISSGFEFGRVVAAPKAHHEIPEVAEAAEPIVRKRK
jgi:hypothetical protein